MRSEVWAKDVNGKDAFIVAAEHTLAAKIAQNINDLGPNMSAWVE